MGGALTELFYRKVAITEVDPEASFNPEEDCNIQDHQELMKIKEIKDTLHNQSPKCNCSVQGLLSN